jgi:acetyltransferase
LAEDGVDGVILLSVPPTFLSPESLARSLALAARDSKKPVLTCLLAGKWVRDARKILEEARLPTFDTADRAARTMINLVKRQQYLSSLGGEVRI